MGTWPLRDADAERLVAIGIGLGYRLIDTAQVYENEVGVGRGMKAGGAPRESLFLISKLDDEWHGIDEAQRAFGDSAARLGVDYIDLYLIHWPLPGQDRYVDAWRGVAKLFEDGRVRGVGVSNFKPAHLERLIDETGIVPDFNQIECNPHVTREAARAYHESHGIATGSWSPLGEGEALSEPILAEIGARYGKTPAQVVLRWHLQLGLIAVPKSAHADRMAENMDIFDFELAPQELAAISALDRGEAAAVDSDVEGNH
jgi:2,5-diketo-D-gluconate reductase A